MNEMLKKDYEMACNAYLRAFIANYDLCEPDGWVADEPGGIAVVGDWYFCFDAIKFAVDNGLTDSTELLEWYDYMATMDGIEGMTAPNFKSWHKGCPRLSAFDIERLVRLQENVKLAQDELSDWAAKLQKAF